jgi:hypothetical protein
MSELVLATYITLCDHIRLLNTWDQYRLLKHVETQFESEADSPLGEFLNEFIVLMLENNTESIHQDLQDLIDVAELNEEMLICIGETINESILF